VEGRKRDKGRGRREGGEGVGAPFNFLPPGATDLVTPLTVRYCCGTYCINVIVVVVVVVSAAVIVVVVVMLEVVKVTLKIKNK